MMIKLGEIQHCIKTWTRIGTQIILWMLYVIRFTTKWQCSICMVHVCVCVCLCVGYLCECWMLNVDWSNNHVDCMIEKRQITVQIDVLKTLNRTRTCHVFGQMNFAEKYRPKNTNERRMKSRNCSNSWKAGFRL